MIHPPRIVMLCILLLLMFLVAACPARQDDAVRIFYPPMPAPDTTLYPPRFEDPATIVSWAQPIAPEGVYDEETPYVVNFEFTPDGQHFIYSVRHPGSYWISLYSVSLTDGEPILLAQGPREVSDSFYYEITADSQRVIYTHGFDDNILYSITVSGTERIELARNIGGIEVSPDGQWVIYVPLSSSELGQTSPLFSVSVTGGESVLLSEGISSYPSGQFTPDGRHVLFTANDDGDMHAPAILYSVPVQGGTPIPLSEPLDYQTLSIPQISRDSQSVFYGNLYRADINSGAVEQLNPSADHPEFEFFQPGSIILSPDERWIIFQSNGDERLRDRILYVMPITGGLPRQLSGPLPVGQSINYFRITPDSQNVYYIQGEFNESDISVAYIVPLAGGQPIALPPWDTFVLSADGQWYLYYEYREDIGTDLYTISSTGGTPIKLTDNLPTLATYGRISPDSSTVYIATSKYPDLRGDYNLIRAVMDGIYAIPINGGEAREITGVAGRDIIYHEITMSPVDKIVIVPVDYDGNGHPALYAFRLENAQPISAP